MARVSAALAAPVSRAALAALAGLLLCGCAGNAPRTNQSRAIPRDHPRVALLPLENLTAAADASEVMTRIFFAELNRSGAVELIDPGNVDAALEALTIRSTASLTSAQYAALGDTLGASYVLVGSLLESGRVRASEGEAPAVGASVRLIEARSGRVVWTGVHFRTGDDRETVFGFGRVNNADQLAAELAEELFKDFREVGREIARSEKSAGGTK